ncbi:hypothetical protein EDB84DRAFT_1585859 [Lactarius hengduanensis]|nr:hypothetical protein EDB84DRAFT_1585859 [Lactarius hengduanensis]
MLLSELIVWSLLSAVATAAPAPSDPCAAIAGSRFSTPKDTLACLRSFPFNQTLRRNVMTTVSRVFDFYTFEDYYPRSSTPFPSTINIRAELDRINSTPYATDYDFNLDLYNTINQLNDGHTLWLPYCYVNWEALLPTPVVSISVDGVEGVYIASDAPDFISLVPSGFTSYYESINFDWKRLAGARVLQIEGLDPYDYVDSVADTVTGNYLDHGVRVNSVFTGYRLSGSSFSQKFGDLAGRVFNPINNLTFSLVPVGATQAEIVTVPFLDVFTGNSFSDRDSYWASNCAANANTNGVDRGSRPPHQQLHHQLPQKPPPKGITRSPSDAIGLPLQFQPTLPVVNTNASYMVSYVLPDLITGVLFVGSFQEPSTEQFQLDLAATIASLRDAGATRLLIDLTNNPGGYLFAAMAYLTGTPSGFQSAVRGNELAQKVVRRVIAEQISEDNSFYVPEQWAFLNDTVFPNDYNYITNGNCASTCAMFSTLMRERHNTTIAVFGGRPGQSIEFKGMAGNQVLEWTDLDSEIKTAGLKNYLLTLAFLSHNWRTAYSYFDEATPIVRFPYTADTYNDPQNLWIFA